MQRTVLSLAGAAEVCSFPADASGPIRATAGSTGWHDAAALLEAAGKLHLLQPGVTDEQDVEDLLAGQVQGLVRGSMVGAAVVARHGGRLVMARPWDIDPALLGPGVTDGEVFSFPCAAGSGVAGMLSAFLGALVESGELGRMLRAHGLLAGTACDAVQGPG